MKQSELSNNNVEFNKDSSQNLTPDHKDSGDTHSEMNEDFPILFDLSEATRDYSSLQSLVNEYSEKRKETVLLENEIEAKREAIKTIRKELKYGRWFDRRKKSRKLTSHEREYKRATMKILKNAIIEDQQKLSELKDKLTSISKKLNAKADYELVKSKSISRDYQTKNSHLVRAMILRLLNNMIDNHPDKIVEILKLDDAQFESAFKDLADQVDAETFVLISGLDDLKQMYLGIIRDTLNAWDPNGQKMLDELVIKDSETNS